MHSTTLYLKIPIVYFRFCLFHREKISFPRDMDDPSQHSPTVRQQKMEKQRQLMKEKQKKKHAQQVQMVQANDVEGRPRSGRRSAGKEERSPLVSNSGRDKGQPSSYGECISRADSSFNFAAMPIPNIRTSERRQKERCKCFQS